MFFPAEFHNFHPDRPNYWNPDGEDPLSVCTEEYGSLPASTFGGPPPPVYPHAPPPRGSPPGYWGDVSGLGGTRLPPPTLNPVHYYPAPPPAMPVGFVPPGFVSAPHLSPFEDRRTWQERHVDQDHDWDYSRQAQAQAAAYDPSLQGAPPGMFVNVPADQTVDPGLDYAIASGFYDASDSDY